MYSNSSSNLLKNRSTLPNLHTQSTFKSLLTNTSNNINNTNNNNINNPPRVYFRPQDLSSTNNRLIQVQQSGFSIMNESELYLLQKNSLERLYNTTDNNKLSLAISTTAPAIPSKMQLKKSPPTATTSPIPITKEENTSNQPTSTPIEITRYMS